MGDEAAHEEQVADEEALRAHRAASPWLQGLWEGDDPRQWPGVEWGDGRVKKLCLERCSWKELPAELWLLTGLTYLDLEDCEQLTALPAELGQLLNLDFLYLKNCKQLAALPAEFGQLTGLTELNLEGCEQLTALPAELGRLTGLTSLYLNGCEQLTALPAELGRLTGLTTLDLTNCSQLTALPAELGRLTGLATLNLGGCSQLTSRTLPAELGLLVNLTRRPEEQVADEEALRALRAASPELQELWEGDDPSKWDGVVWGDGRVRGLDLEDCPLKELPAQVGRLTGLTTLFLYNCEQLTALPAELGQLTGLNTLELCGCKQLKALPAELGRLTGLATLDLRGCKQLTLPPGAPKDKETATPIIAAYAAILRIVEPRKDVPETLHAFLRDTPEVTIDFFKYILTDPIRRDWLGQAIKATPDLADLTGPDGGRTVGVVTQEQVADEEALRALRAASPELQELWEGAKPAAKPAAAIEVDSDDSDDSDDDSEDEEGDDPRKWRGVKWVDGRVRGLHLYRCPLKELPAQVGLLTGLTELNLESCRQLTALPAELGLLTGLTTLYLAGCEQLTALPAELGLLTGLTTLDLGGCSQLMELPAELGQLTALTTLYLAGCEQLTALPAELGLLVNLTSLYLDDCDQLTLPPGAPANAKEIGAVAAPTIAAYVRLFIVEPRKDTPEQLHAFLLATPRAAPPFFKIILTDAAHAEWLGKAVKATPELARLTDPDGRRAIDVAVPACKQQMQAALYLFGRFDVDDGPLLHRSATSAVAAADDHTDPKAKPVPRVALKAMQGLEQVRAELQGRAEGLEPEHVVAVRAVYADEGAVDQADGDAWRQVQDAAAKLVIEVKIITGLSSAIQAHLFPASKPQESDESVAAESSKQGLKRQPTSAALAAASSEYKFLVVMDFADRNLSHSIIHEHIAGEDFHSVRAIAAELARALDHLHSKGLIQADHKPNNAVAFGGDWKLIDLDVSCKIGQPFGNKIPSSGYCPPEMAVVLLQATDDQGKVDGAKLAKYQADAAYDLWSFGTVLYHLIFGRPLWLTDVDDNVTPADLRTLAAVPDKPLRRALDKALYDGERRNANVDLKVATALLRKLLEPDEQKRMAHFPVGMKGLVDEPFFLGATLEDSTLQQLLAGQEKMHAGQEALKANQEKMMTKLDVLTDMSEEHRTELLISRKVLKKAIYEATEVLTPTTFIILEDELPSEEEEQELLLALKLKDDGSGFEASGQLVDAAEKAKEQFDKAKTWLDRMKTFGEGVIEGNADKVFGKVKEVLGDLVTGKTMYFYLVDELTGKPVRADGYPIEITTPSEIVPKLLPVMQVGMRAMSLYNGVAGIAQMFGAPVPMVPKQWREGAQASVELLKQESSVEAFGAVHEAVKADQHGEHKTTRGASLRELQRLFEKEDPDKGYAGLRRIAADDGAAVWTALSENDVAAQLDKRGQERREEERRALRDEIRRELLSAPAASSSSLVEVAIETATPQPPAPAQQEASHTAGPALVQVDVENERLKEENAELKKEIAEAKAKSCCVIG